MARLVIPDILYHVTQHGNGGQRVFSSQADFVTPRKPIRQRSDFDRSGISQGTGSRGLELVLLRHFLSDNHKPCYRPSSTRHDTEVS
jgi:hypothetical protein